MARGLPYSLPKARQTTKPTQPMWLTLGMEGWAQWGEAGSGEVWQRDLVRSSDIPGREGHLKRRSRFASPFPRGPTVASAP